MRKIRCIIVDDEPLAVEGIEIYLKEIDFLELIGTFSNALQLGVYLENNAVDLIFLDIEMPHLSGIDFLKTRENKILTILTTAYPQFALDAFALNVVDYLLKPFRFERFLLAVNKAKNLHFLQNPLDETANDFIFVKSERRHIKVYFKDIEYISGLKDYVILYTVTGKIITSMNIKTIYEQLPQDLFSRTSKSFIINIDYIKAVHPNSIELHSKEIPLGKGYKETFFTSHVASKTIKRKS